MTFESPHSSKKIVRIIILVLLVSVLLLLIFVLLNYFLFLNYDVENERNEAHQYRIYRTNPETGSSFSGFTTIQNELKDEEFLSYQDDSGNHVLISRFDSNEYECRGTCICEMPSEESMIRRSAGSNILKYPLFQLIAATTTAIAFSVAKKRFEGECENTFSSSCPSNGIIRSEIDDCIDRSSIYIQSTSNDHKKILGDDFYEDPEVREQVEKSEQYDKHKHSEGFFKDVRFRLRKFECYGKCQEYYFYDLDEDEKRPVKWYKKYWQKWEDYWNRSQIAKEKRLIAKGWKQKKYDENCENIDLETKVEYMMTDEILEMEIQKKEGWEDAQIQFARRIFAEDNLSHLCIIQSMVDVDSLGLFEPVCIGQHPKIEKVNPTVVCTRTDDEESVDQDSLKLEM